MDHSTLPGIDRKTAAFTVTELLVSFGIIALLVSILSPVFSQTRKASQNATCVNNLKQLASGVHLYAMENNGSVPWGYNNLVPWFQYLQHSDRHLGKYNNRGVLPNPNYPQNRREVLTVYQCPANPWRIGRWYDPNYAYNRELGYRDMELDINGKRLRLQEVATPQRIVLLADGGYRKKSTLSIKDGPEKTVYPATTAKNGTAAFWNKSVGFDWHHGHANLVFLDGHVKAFTKEETERALAEKSITWKP
ncbi:MAG TPA: hypothetical protein VNQ90_13340 [Chthoniobacteraceae bacterium]|nr:hypothetical protein [Chthoniobacteraceae bacterium]